MLEGPVALFQDRIRWTWRERLRLPLDQGLIFTTDTGAPSNLRRRSFAPLLRKANLPHIRFHDLRHTCATLLLSKGTHPKFVQELLGHATVAITLDTYSHVMPGMGDQTARAMQDALSPMEDASS